MASKPTYLALTLAMIDQNIGLTTGVFIITPAFAKEVLATRNPVNRKISEAKVMQIKHDIESGDYALNGESIIFGSDGNLVDAQHRMTAIAETGKPVVSAVTIGVDPKTRETVDQGRVRTTGDVNTMAGMTNGNTMAAVAKLLVSYYAGDGSNLGRMGTLSRTEVMHYQTAHAAKLAPIVSWAVSHLAHCKGTVTTTQLAVARAILEPIYGSIVEDFLNRVAIGDNIGQNHPAFVARRKLREGKNSNVVALEILMRTFLAFREGRTLRTVPVMGDLPKLNKTARGINKGPLSSGTALQSGTATGPMSII